MLYVLPHGPGGSEIGVLALVGTQQGLFMPYGDDDRRLDGPERTLRELACVLDVSAERVRKIEQAALDRLRATVAGGDVHEHLTNPRWEPAC